MAIYQRDRDFHRLFSEIDIDVVPLKFVRDITCHLGDGTKIVLEEKDFSEHDLEHNDIENLVRNLEFYESLVDLSIRINYDRVEDDTRADVEKILNKLNR